MVSWQARYLTRMWLSNAAAGVATSIWYLAPIVTHYDTLPLTWVLCVLLCVSRRPCCSYPCLSFSRYDYRDRSGKPSDEEAHFGVVESDYQNASMPYRPKPSYLAARVLQQTFGLGRWRIMPGQVPTAKGPRDLRVVRFIRGADGATGFASWRACDDDCGFELASFSVEGLMPKCFDMIEMDGAVVGQVCGGHDEQIAVNVGAAPQYLLPSFSYSQAKHYH